MMVVMLTSYYPTVDVNVLSDMEMSQILNVWLMKVFMKGHRIPVHSHRIRVLKLTSLFS